MERRFSNRESILLGYSPQKPFTNQPISSPNTSSCRNSDVDIDFNDVFGGPPRRRSSVQEVRCSFGETTDSSRLREDDKAIVSSSPWATLSEKPVFGEESSNWRRYPSHDFFDDIFKGNKSVSSSPRKLDRDPFSSSPGSSGLSPVRPLPPKAEPFGTGQFSLPAKLAKGVDLPAFGASTRSLYKNKDGASNGMSFYSYSPLSRSSGQEIETKEEVKNDAQSSYQQSPLSQELFPSSRESLNESGTKETEGDMKKDSGTLEVSAERSEFHFSIYKWASKGVPLMMSRWGENGSSLKDKNKFERSSSSNGRMESMNVKRDISMSKLGEIILHPEDGISTGTKSLRREHNKQEHDAFSDTCNQVEVTPCQIVEEAKPSKPESKTPTSTQAPVNSVEDNAFSIRSREEAKPQSALDIGSHEKTKKEMSEDKKNVPNGELRHQRVLFNDNDNETYNSEKNKKAGKKESMVKTAKKSSRIADFSKNVEKKGERRNSMDSEEVHIKTSLGSPMNLGDLGKNKVEGKVKEFIKIFSHEAPSKAKLDADSQHQSCRKDRVSSREENEAVSNTTKMDEKIKDVQKKKTQPDAPVMVDVNNQLKKQRSVKKSTKNSSDDTYCLEKDSSASSTVPIPNSSTSIVGDTDESFQENFLIKELTQDDDEVPKTDNDSKETRVIDAKIRQWSNGKEGNIRSLLSTLQYVLWPGSGWKPIPLVDIIEGNAVKRSYQKALLCLHPDKLQQKGATSHQKYIAEKVFDILQDSWTHFNSLGAL